MKKRIQYIFRHYWVELIAVPPFVLGACYILYGEVYFSSWTNFLRITAPWLCASIISPICCHWVRNTTLRRFTRLEDWPKRVLWSVSGYMFFTVGFAKLTYLLLTTTRYAGFVPSQEIFLGLLIVSAMCVLIISALYEGITYFDKWKSALTETERLEKLSIETQVQSLQSQLNPHFLFNSFNVLSSLIAENPQRAEDFVDELSNVYRYLLRSNDRELASVADELRFIRSFFHLLETRHDAGISLNINVSQALQDKKLPTLALQILVENAVKHNEICLERPLHIEISDNKHPSEGILVRNNLQYKTARVSSNRVGLDNLRQRYELLGLNGFAAGREGDYFAVKLPVI